MPDPIKLKVDLASGLIEVEADSASIELVFEHLNTFLPRLSNALRPAETEETKGAPDSAEEDDVGPEPGKKKRSSSRSTTRAKETYRVVDLKLSPDDREELRAYYSQKNPRNQNEQTAVLMDWLKREKGLKELDKDQVFTAFRTVEEKAPGKISSVLGNMLGQGWVVNRGGKYEITHVAEDHVRLNLPRKKKQK